NRQAGARKAQSCVGRSSGPLPKTGERGILGKCWDARNVSVWLIRTTPNQNQSNLLPRFLRPQSLVKPTARSLGYSSRDHGAKDRRKSPSIMIQSLLTPQTPGTGVQSNKVVVALVDKRRIKGFVYNFSAVRETFSVFPTESAHKNEANDIRLKDVKAVFFVK